MYKHKGLRRCAAAGMLVLVLAACGAADLSRLTGKATKVNAAEMAQLAVEPYYLESIETPDSLTLTVTLADVSKADAAAWVIKEVKQYNVGEQPYSAVLTYNPDVIDSRHRYSVSAQLHVGTMLLFTSTTHYDPFRTGITQPLRVRMEPVGGRPVGSETEELLLDSIWQLAVLADSAVPVGASEHGITLQLHSGLNKASGSAGCNLFNGSYQLGMAGELQFGPLASTRKMCANGMSLEQAVLQMLAATVAYSIAGDSLVLLDENGSSLAVYNRLEGDSTAATVPQQAAHQQPLVPAPNL